MIIIITDTTPTIIENRLMIVFMILFTLSFAALVSAALQPFALATSKFAPAQRLSVRLVFWAETVAIAGANSIVLPSKVAKNSFMVLIMGFYIPFLFLVC